MVRLPDRIADGTSQESNLACSSPVRAVQRCLRLAPTSTLQPSHFGSCVGARRMRPSVSQSRVEGIRGNHGSSEVASTATSRARPRPGRRMSSSATAELEAGPTNGALRVVGRAPSSGVRRNSGSVSPTSRPDMRIVHAVRAHDIRVSADGFAAFGLECAFGARRVGPP